MKDGTRPAASRAGLARSRAVAIAVAVAVAASLSVLSATAHGASVGQTLPRVEILPSDGATAAPYPAIDPARSATTIDLAKPEWTAAADWRGLAAEVPGLSVRVGDGGLSTSYGLRGHALTRTLLDGLPDVMRLFVRDPATVRSVAVMRGAAGVDQGIGSPGGMLAMSTPLPSSRAARRVDLQVGADDARRLVVDLDQPLAPGWLARLVLASQDGRSEPGGLTQRRDHLLGTLAWLPGARPADGGVRLVAERQISRNPYGFGTVLTPAGQIRYDRLYASPWQTSWRGVSQVAAHGWQVWQATPDQRLSLRADVAQARGHRDETLIGSWDQRSDGKLNGYYTHVLDDHRQRSARLEALWRIEADGTPHEARHDTRFGLDRLHRHWLLSGVQNLRGYVIDAEAPDFSGLDPATLAMSPRHRHQRFDESGRYLRHRIDWPGELAVSVGLRQVAFAEAAAAPAAAMTTLHEIGGPHARVHDLSIERISTAGWQAALNWAQGIEPNTGRSRSGDWMPPQRSALLELVLRPSQPLSGDMPSGVGAWQLALYRIRLDGLTRSDPVDRNFLVADAARQVSGLELGLPWRSGAWTLSAQFNAMRLRWLQAPGASVGARPVNMPQRTAAVRLERRLDGLLDGRLDGSPDAFGDWREARLWLQWQGRSALYADSANRSRIAGTGIVDVGLQGSSGDWQVVLLVSNLADRDHVASVASVDEVYQGVTRQWRLGLSRRW